MNGPQSRGWFWANTVLAVAILVPALYGFGTKFREFVLLYGGYEKAKEQQRFYLEKGKQAELAHQQDEQGLSEEATEGAFALMPILNYLLVSFGFLLLFAAAVLHGMFRDIEAPKHQMLATETVLDGLEKEART